MFRRSQTWTTEYKECEVCTYNVMSHVEGTPPFYAWRVLLLLVQPSSLTPLVQQLARTTIIMNRFIALLLLCAIAVQQINGHPDADAKHGGNLAYRANYCGATLYEKVRETCHAVRGVSNQEFLDSKDANTFLFGRGIEKRGLHHECCTEGCSIEEIYESC
ncbi:uncharacterized protein LOC110989828 isoform X2 [Acanthaster planci]|uniref:Uncharacterized protein LOC110989828 isoform X2 n=1 Tax=Acanthaster planci TaxID=133434 RepID=A0A8B7ZYK2_ACAPL|nr:uncharacterized protein LOC110989828 isoform X2 [Acanthaster planci]